MIQKILALIHWQKQPQTKIQLKRVLSLPLVIFYSLGTILGAGIYVLVGKVAFYAGIYAPLAFIIAGALATLSAFSYAELSSRFPQTAGAAEYIKQGFNRKSFATLVGFAVILSGIISAAVLAHGFAGYFQTIFNISELIIIIGVLIATGALVIWGIQASAWIIAIITSIEIGGLFLVLWAAKDNFSKLPTVFAETPLNLNGEIWLGVIMGSFLAFYAFIGFEDTVNIAEETKNPRQTMPKAIIIAVTLSLIFYAAVSLAAVLTLPTDALITSKAPLALIVEKGSKIPPIIMIIISLFAVINGIIAQIVMSSRILYGMSQKKWIPTIFSRLSATTQTPVFSTILVVLIILVFAWLLPIVPLANLTSFITLMIFALINLALLIIKLKHDKTAKNIFTIPIWIPILGFLANSGVILQKIWITF